MNWELKFEFAKPSKWKKRKLCSRVVEKGGGVWTWQALMLHMHYVKMVKSQ